MICTGEVRHFLFGICCEFVCIKKTGISNLFSLWSKSKDRTECHLSLQAEAELTTLKQDHERYILETEEKLQNLNTLVETLTEEKKSLSNALDEEKR